MPFAVYSTWLFCTLFKLLQALAAYQIVAVLYVRCLACGCHGSQRMDCILVSSIKITSTVTILVKSYPFAVYPYDFWSWKSKLSRPLLSPESSPQSRDQDHMPYLQQSVSRPQYLPSWTLVFQWTVLKVFCYQILKMIGASLTRCMWMIVHTNVYVCLYRMVLCIP